VGKDVTRFFFLNRSLNTHMDFDLELAKEHSEKNPVYYVQYAHARIQSINNKLKAKSSKLKVETQNIKLLKHPAEINLIKQLIKLPDLIEEIVGDWQVQKLPFYSIELAKSFHNFYEKCPIIKAGDEKLTIPSGTQPGKVFKLRNKGIPHLRRSGRGDQLVIINVDIPSHLNNSQRQLFEQLADTLGSEVLPQERSFLDILKDVLGG